MPVTVAICCSENQTLKIAKSYEALAVSFWFNLGSAVQSGFLRNSSVHNFYINGSVQ